MTILPQMPVVAILLMVFWFIRGDVLKMIERLESRIDRLIELLIDQQGSEK